MKAKFLLAAAIIMALAIGTVNANPITGQNLQKREMVKTQAKKHHRYHKKHHHNHQMMKNMKH